jgi:hypothetical protein
VRIAEDSPQRLVLRDRTLWIGVLFLFAAVFLVYMSFRQPHPAGMWVGAGLFVLFGLAFFSASDVVFDRATGEVTLIRLMLWRRSQRVLRFSEIKEVQIEDSPGERVPTCRLALVTAERSFPLTTVYDQGRKSYEEMRAAVLRALGRAVGPVPDPLESLVRQGRIVEAVELLRRQENLDLTTARERVREMEHKLKGG